jgi:uncharacterized protein YciI
MRTALCLFALVACCFGQDKKAQPKFQGENYVVCLLTKGEKWTPAETPETRKIQEGHMANIRSMAATGKLIVAGPFADDSALRGMFIFRTTLEDARAMTSVDPAVKAGRLVPECHPWFAGKGLNVPEPH